MWWAHQKMRLVLLFRLITNVGALRFQNSLNVHLCSHFPDMRFYFRKFFVALREFSTRLTFRVSQHTPETSNKCKCLIKNRARLQTRWILPETNCHLWKLLEICWIFWSSLRILENPENSFGGGGRIQWLFNFETLMHQRYELHKLGGFWPKIPHFATFSSRAYIIWKVISSLNSVIKP